MSSYHDTDSSNDSFESDSSCHNVVNVSNTLAVTDNHEKWIDQLTNVNSWKMKEDQVLWSENRIKRWKNLKSSEERSNNWPESGGESFLKSLIRTPIMHEFPPPPKPDSPPEVLF